LEKADPSVENPWSEDGSGHDPALLQAILRVRDREGYAWVECGVCDAGWQVPHYAARSVG
jgi:hypothetical protein